MRKFWGSVIFVFAVLIILETTSRADQSGVQTRLKELVLRQKEILSTVQHIDGLMQRRKDYRQDYLKTYAARKQHDADARKAQEVFMKRQQEVMDLYAAAKKLRAETPWYKKDEEFDAKVGNLENSARQIENNILPQLGREWERCKFQVEQDDKTLKDLDQKNSAAESELSVILPSPEELKRRLMIEYAKNDSEANALWGSLSPNAQDELIYDPEFAKLKKSEDDEDQVIQNTDLPEWVKGTKIRVVGPGVADNDSNLEGLVPVNQPGEESQQQTAVMTKTPPEQPPSKGEVEIVKAIVTLEEVRREKVVYQRIKNDTAATVTIKHGREEKILGGQAAVDILEQEGKVYRVPDVGYVVFKWERLYGFDNPFSELPQKQTEEQWDLTGPNPQKLEPDKKRIAPIRMPNKNTARDSGDPYDDIKVK